MRIDSFALGILLAGVAASSHAYQTDFHYGMTYWLGQQAQLTADESAVLASGNEWKDSGMLDARPVIAYNVCWKNEPDAFKLMRENHFRASAEYPAPPPERKVQTLTTFASEQVVELIKKTQPAAPSSPVANNRIVDFGGALHGFQDTYSHQGESQVPPGCNASSVWTHPRIRNGETGPLPNWLGTGADQTHRWLADCENAAHATYDHLRNFVGKLFPARTRAPNWSDALRNEVRDFCGKSTKSEKADWLKSHGVPQEQAIVDSSSLEDGSGSYKSNLWRTLDLKGFATNPADRAPEARKLELDMERLAAKVERGNISPDERAVLERYLEALVKGPAASLPERLAPLIGVPGTLPANHPFLITTQRLRFVDRGLAARDPLPVNQLSNPDADIGAVPLGLSSNWRDFLVRPRGQQIEQPYIVASDSGRIVAFALLRHAPYEVIRVDLKAGGKATVISGVTVAAMH